MPALPTPMILASIFLRGCDDTRHHTGVLSLRRYTNGLDQKAALIDNLDQALPSPKGGAFLRH
jgi:hypothetical protein